MGDRRVAISPLQGFDRERNLGSQGVGGFAAVALGYCISPLRGFKPTATTYRVEQTKVVQGSGQTHGFGPHHVSIVTPSSLPNAMMHPPVGLNVQELRERMRTI